MKLFSGLPRLLRRIAMTSFALYAMTAHATPADELKTMLTNIKSMQASFTQTIYDNHGKAVGISNGNMLMERPGKFRWEVKKPIPQLIIANQSTLWIYDPDLEQVTIRKLAKATGETPALLLSHVDANIEKTYVIKKFNADGLLWFAMLPKDKEGMFEQILFGFDKQQVSQMKLKDHLDHDTLIKFSNIKTNMDIADSHFDFKSPKNTDVIDETKR